MDPSFLQSAPLFQGLTLPQARAIAAVARPVVVERGQFIFREGDDGDAMYFIAEGQVRISQNVSGMGEEALAVLRPGQYFGEMALVEGTPRSADAIAHTSAGLWAIDRVRLEQLLFIDKELAYVLLWAFVRTLSGRLRESNEKLKTFFAASKF
ncbi:MAG: cyclic nucleotide-binding domain-containing protein [Myxococcaceae bacterium]